MAKIPQSINFKLPKDGPHGRNLYKKYKSTGDASLQIVIGQYENYLKKISSISFSIENIKDRQRAIGEIVQALNEYRTVALPVLDKRKNSGQENLHSTILEEFFEILISPFLARLTGDASASVSLGKANSYSSLNFTPRSFQNLLEDPEVNIHTKDQDFVLGCKVTISASAEGSTKKCKKNTVVVPVVAIECKTYIERNMLDSCAGTAQRLKAAMPYCIYIVVSEYMKMKDAFPELTAIDEVFILTRANNSERLLLAKESGGVHEIAQDLIEDIFNLVEAHIQSIWWDPEEAVKRGRVIGRPNLNL